MGGRVEGGDVWWGVSDNDRKGGGGGAAGGVSGGEADEVIAGVGEGRFEVGTYTEEGFIGHEVPLKGEVHFFGRKGVFGGEGDGERSRTGKGEG